MLANVHWVQDRKNQPEKECLTLGVFFVQEKKINTQLKIYYFIFKLPLDILSSKEEN